MYVQLIDVMGVSIAVRCLCCIMSSSSVRMFADLNVRKDKDEIITHAWCFNRCIYPLICRRSNHYCSNVNEVVDFEIWRGEVGLSQTLDIIRILTICSHKKRCVRKIMFVIWKKCNCFIWNLSRVSCEDIVVRKRRQRARGGKTLIEISKVDVEWIFEIDCIGTYLKYWWSNTGSFG